MTMQFATDSQMSGDVAVRVLDNDGDERFIINEEAPTQVLVRWKITGPHYWAYAIGNATWRVRVKFESIGPGADLTIPAQGAPAHTVAAPNTFSLDAATDSAEWRTVLTMPTDGFGADQVYKPVAVVDFRADPAIVATEVQVAGFAEYPLILTREDPDSP